MAILLPRTNKRNWSLDHDLFHKSFALNSVQPHILSIPSPFAFENGVVKVLEPPETDQRTLVNRLLGGRYE